MNGRSNDDNVPDPEPWANDERLKDVMQVGTVNKVITLIKLLAAALEKAPVAPMPKTQSIPMLWESAKELKQKKLRRPPERIPGAQGLRDESGEIRSRKCTTGTVCDHRRKSRRIQARAKRACRSKAHTKRPRQEVRGGHQLGR
jgi:hypothetical protein